MRFGATAREVGPYTDILSTVRAIEHAGFDSVWVSEHHVQPAVGDQYWPAPLLRIAAMAGETSSVDFLTSALVLPLHNPLEIAEQVAVLDRVTDGRITVGVGLGYVEEEFDAFGHSLDDRAGRLVEGLRILDGYLSADDSFSFDGKIWNLSDWRPTPTTVQDPRPPILVGGWGDLALKRSLRLGDGWIAGLTADVDALAERHGKLERLGDRFDVQTVDRPRPVMRETVIAESREAALDLGRRYLHPVYEETYCSEDWSHPLLNGVDVTDFEELADGRFLVGDPDDVVRQIRELKRRAGITEVGCRFHFPGMDQGTVERQIELFGSEVLPAFTDTRAVS